MARINGSSDTKTGRRIIVRRSGIHGKGVFALADIPKGTRLKITAHFDNSANNPLNPDPAKIIRWGSASETEMLPLRWTPNFAASRAVCATFAQATMALVGVQPVLTQVPPKRLRSMIATFIRAPARQTASDGPACPVPMMIASYRVVMRAPLQGKTK